MTQQVWMGRGRPDALTGWAQQVGRGRLTRSRVRIGSTVLVALAALAALTATFQTYADPRLLFMDVIAGAQASGYCCRGYYGVMSNMGAIGWALAAGVALFAALCLWARGGAHADGMLLGFGGVLSLALCLDDLLLLHESILPGWGVPQVVVLGGYALAGLAYAFAQRRRLFSRDGGFLLLAFLLLGGSMAVDVLLHSTQSWLVAAEDGLKFVGIYAWLAFHIDLAQRAVLEG